jgi:hypothetical protein
MFNAGSMTRAKCYASDAVVYAVCEYVDGDTSVGESCKFPFK